MGKILSFLGDLFTMIVDLLKMVVSSLITLFQMLTTGIPAVLKVVANMPPFVVGGVTITISITLCMVLLGRRSS